MSKYHSQKCEIDGIKFDSKAESRRYKELKMLEKCGAIKNLQLQVPFELIPKQNKERAVTYKADFVYIQNGERIVEDVKGKRTAEYIIKRKLMLFRYGIRIKEVS